MEKFEFTLDQQLEIVVLAEKHLIRSHLIKAFNGILVFPQGLGLCSAIECAIDETGYLTTYYNFPQERRDYIEPFKRVNAMQFGAHPTEMWWWHPLEMRMRIDFLHWMQEYLKKRMQNGK